MTRSEMLLTHLIEECDEVSQRATKALRFGLAEIQSGQGRSNAQRIVDEFRDLLAIVDMLEDEGILPPMSSIGSEVSRHIQEKRVKVEAWLEYSRKQGTIQ